MTVPKAPKLQFQKQSKPLTLNPAHFHQGKGPVLRRLWSPLTGIYSFHTKPQGRAGSQARSLQPQNRHCGSLVLGGSTSFELRALPPTRVSSIINTRDFRWAEWVYLSALHLSPLREIIKCLLFMWKTSHSGKWNFPQQSPQVTKICLKKKKLQEMHDFWIWGKSSELFM